MKKKGCKKSAEWGTEIGAEVLMMILLMRQANGAKFCVRCAMEAVADVLLDTIQEFATEYKKSEESATKDTEAFFNKIMKER